MKIGIDARAVTQFPGIGRYGENLIEALIRIDRDNEYVIFKNPAWSFPSRPQENVKTVDVNIPLVSFGSLFAFRSIVNPFKFDVFHSLCEILPLGGDYVRIITVHDIINLALPWAFKHHKIHKDFALRAYFKTIGRLGIKRAAQVITVSQHTKDDLAGLTGTELDKMTVIYEAADAGFRKCMPDELHGIAEKYDLPSRFLFYIGSFKKNKNIPRLLIGFSRYLADNPEDTTLHLVLGGFKQYDLSPMHDLVKMNGLQGRVQLSGYIEEEDLAKIYNLSMALIYPSTYEGFGLPVLEAMACQTTIICSNVTSIPEVGGDAVCYFDPFDPEDIAQKISNVVHDPAYVQDLHAKGVKQLQKFSWEKCARETLAVYTEKYLQARN